MKKQTSRLRELLKAGPTLFVPGCFNAMSARVLENVGFPAIYMSGYGTSLSLTGLPDAGLVTMTEVITNARYIAQAVNIPVIADADNGYGNAINVIRTVREFIGAGIAGIHLEDQVSPKRCGHMAGKQVIERAEAVQKVRAAVDAETGLVIIARTDALSVLGLPEAIARVTEYAEAGADLVFVEGAADEETLALVHEAIPGIGLVVNISEADPRLRPLPLDVLASYGVRVALYPVAPLLAAAAATQRAYVAIAEDGSASTVDRLTWDELTDLLDLPYLLDLEARYADGDS